MDSDALITARHQALEGVLDERQRRLHAAVEAKVLGHGGVKRVSLATGVARGSILAGIKELESPQRALQDGPRRVRRPGAGRKKRVERDPDVREALERLVEPTSRGDPQSPLRWTCKSLMQLARELSERGHAISHVSVGLLLKNMGLKGLAAAPPPPVKMPPRSAPFPSAAAWAPARAKATAPVVKALPKGHRVPPPAH